MISLVEALNFKCFRDVQRRLENFHILVGPNASGKSTFLDIIALLGELGRRGARVGDVIGARSSTLRDIVWMRRGSSFELAVEAVVPEEVSPKLKNGDSAVVRYEVGVGEHRETAQPCLELETLSIGPVSTLQPSSKSALQRTLFPMSVPPRETILRGHHKQALPGWKTIVRRTVESENTYFISETSRWQTTFNLAPDRSALGNLPDDERRFPIALWFREMLSEGVKLLSLRSVALRNPCPPGSPVAYQVDGSNLPLVVKSLNKADSGAKERWISHLRTSLPSIKDIRSIRRPEDQHSYLKLKFDSGLELPSWLVSDGTLRLLAISLLAYAPGIRGPFLIEEPENGIHPMALETLYQSLSSIYDTQVLAATHSPVLLSLAKPSEILCFALAPDGDSVVVSGDKHPRLKGWKHEVDLGTLFASGVLG